MLFLAAAVYFSAPSCPPAFSFTNTTVGAISDSKTLSLCVSKAVLVPGTDGSVKLVLNSSATAPKCLVYPNGLSPDLTFDLLNSGHTGCWSLYPPSQPVIIVNVGKPSQAKVTSELQSFRPVKPLILINPSQGIKLGERIAFSSSAKQEVLKCNLFRLPCRIRFTPISYSWIIVGVKNKQAKPSINASQLGSQLVNLSVTYSLEYSFNGLTSWQRVMPNIVMNAAPRTFEVGRTTQPTPRLAPRLVNSPCLFASSWGC
jgi:hypothetical protein